MKTILFTNLETLTSKGEVIPKTNWPKKFQIWICQLQKVWNGLVYLKTFPRRLWCNTITYFYKSWFITANEFASEFWNHYFFLDLITKKKSYFWEVLNNKTFTSRKWNWQFTNILDRDTYRSLVKIINQSHFKSIWWDIHSWIVLKTKINKVYKLLHRILWHFPISFYVWT